MRIDLFLSLTGVFKTRSISGKACRTGHVTLGGRQAKASLEVKQGDVIGSVSPDGTPVWLEVMSVPATRQISRKDRGLYIRYLDAPPEEMQC